jgi:hypothetical protein
MYDLIGQGRSWISVLYNLGLVTVTSVLLGLLLSHVTDLLKKEYPSYTGNGDDNEKAGTQE